MDYKDPNRAAATRAYGSTILYYTILYYTILYYTDTMLYQYYAILILCYAILNYIILILCYTILY